MFVRRRKGGKAKVGAAAKYASTLHQITQTRQTAGKEACSEVIEKGDELNNDGLLTMLARFASLDCTAVHSIGLDLLSDQNSSILYVTPFQLIHG